MSREKSTKISGYLEKRGKLSIMGRWKKWWCVLEGQLLLYYKSRIEYTNLSPCCGSLNMALVKNVQPYVDFQIHITTHTQLIVLRTKNKERQQQWFHALIGVLPQNSYLSPLLYFSTNSIDYQRKSEVFIRKKKSKHKASGEIEIMEHDESSLVVKSDNDISNAANESNFNVFENHILTEEPKISSSQEEIQFHVMNVPSASECNLHQNKCANSTIKCSSEINIRRYSSYHSVINAVTISERIADRRCISCECIFFTEYRTNAVQQYDLLSSCSIRSDEGSQQNNRYPGDSNDNIKSKHGSRRRSKNSSKKYNTLSRRSLSFFKKIFKRRTENQNEILVKNHSSQETIEVSNDSTPMIPVGEEANILEPSISELREINIIQTTENNELMQNKTEEIEPYNNLVEQNTSSNNETETELEFLDTESDIDTVEDSQDDDKLPDLPIKNSNRSPYNYQDFKDFNSNYTTKVITQNNTNTKELSSIGNCPSMELDSLLLQLSVLNNECDKSHESLEFQNNIIEDPDYDIPRPHTSLISDAGSMSDVYEKNLLEVPRLDNLSTQKYDSLSIDMAPDSLEMPWLLNDSKCNMNFWTTKREFDLCLENDSGSEPDYQDSLNSSKYT